MSSLLAHILMPEVISCCPQMVAHRRMQAAEQTVEPEEHQKSGLQVVVDLFGTWLEVLRC
ncbi:unnamed protein product [Urochloa humidicola]